MKTPLTKFIKRVWHDIAPALILVLAFWSIMPHPWFGLFVVVLTGVIEELFELMLKSLSR